MAIAQISLVLVSMDREIRRPLRRIGGADHRGAPGQWQISLSQNQGLSLIGRAILAQ
jgi:hypothetical protein